MTDQFDSRQSTGLRIDDGSEAKLTMEGQMKVTVQSAEYWYLAQL